MELLHVAAGARCPTRLFNLLTVRTCMHGPAGTRRAWTLFPWSLHMLPPGWVFVLSGSGLLPVHGQRWCLGASHVKCTTATLILSRLHVALAWFFMSIAVCFPAGKRGHMGLHTPSTAPPGPGVEPRLGQAMGWVGHASRLRHTLNCVACLSDDPMESCPPLRLLVVYTSSV